MAGHLKLMVNGINTAYDCPQKILSQDKAQLLAIILSDLNDKTSWTHQPDLWRSHHYYHIIDPCICAKSWPQ